MTGRKSGLGRGLESLIPVSRPHSGFTTIPVDRVSPNPLQPRRHFDDEGLEALAASIREVGVLQPIIVREAGEDDYVLIAGERRWRASRMAGFDEVPAIVRDPEEVGTLAEALIENLQREDLGPLEEASAYQQLLDDFDLTHEEVGRRVGRSRTAVTNALRLLQLPAPIQGMLDRGDLSAGHARALLGLEDEAFAGHIADRVVKEGWSVRQVEDAVRARGEQPAAVRLAGREPKVRPAEIIELEGRLGERLGAPVKIDFTGRAGKIVVKFKTLDDLERLYGVLFGD